MIKSLLISLALLVGIIAFAQDLPAEVQKGIKFLDNGDEQNALKQFEKAVRKYPTNAYAHFYLGEAKSRINPFTGWEEFNQAIELDSTIAQAYAGRGSSFYVKNNNYSAALADYNKAVSLDPENWGYYYNRSSLRFEMKDYQGCIEDVDRTFKLFEDADQSIYISKAFSLHKLGKSEEALLLMNKYEYIVLSDYDFGYYEKRGEIKLELNDKKGACSDFTTAKNMRENINFELTEELINALKVCE